MPGRKWCFVPKCTSTSTSTPQKVFLTVPRVPERRKQWFAAARRDVKEVSPTSAMFCCEDHFDLEKDMDNYMEYKMSNVRARMNPDVAPHKFACQPDRYLMFTKKRVHIEKGESHKDIAEYLQSAAGPVRKMALRAKQLNSGESVLHSDEIKPFAAVYIKEEQPEIDSIDTSCCTSEQHPNEGVSRHNSNSCNEKRPEVPGFASNEWEINRTVSLDEAENPLAETPSVRSELQSSEYIFISENQYCEMKPCLKANMDIKEEPEELLLHEELVIKEENEGEWQEANDDHFVSVCGLDSNSSGTGKQTTDECSKLNQSDYKTANFEDLEQLQKLPRQKLFACDQCDYRCSRKTVLTDHQMIHLGEKPFACEECDFTTVYSNSFKKHHKKKHSGEKPVACNQCDYTTLYSHALKDHQMKHLGLKPFACDQCDDRFSRKSILKRHQMIHSGEKPFACDQCDYKAIQLRNFKLHQLKHVGEKSFACNQCDFTTLYPNSLKKHQLKHSGEKQFACEQCSYVTANHDHLKQHQIVHSDEKPFACDQCTYKGATSTYLKRHQMVHSGEKPFACHQCDYKAIQLRNFKLHQLKHLGEKSFSCSQCGFTTLYLTSLNKHQLKHSGEKPFACGQCS